VPNEVLVDHVNSISVITINRPEARNAINQAVTVGVAAALDELDERDDLTVGIITGAGGTFCAGMDLKAFLAGESVSLPGRGLLGMCTRPPRKPMIATVEGWALAGGFEVALACDLIVAAENAKFGIPEVKRGLIAAAGGLLRLPYRIAPAIAMGMALTGDPLTAEQACQCGLVNFLSPEGEALSGALTLAARIAANAPLAVAATKQILVSARDWSVEEGFEEQQSIVSGVFASADAREGAAAFADKRAPVWRGR
jgi:enoyl-CoA hydratase